MNQKELNIYFRKIRLLLPIYSKAEKQFLKDFKDSVFVFIEKNPLCTMDDVIERFSTPEEVVHDYISEALATENLCQKIQFRRFVKKILLTTAHWHFSRACSSHYRFAAYCQRK